MKYRIIALIVILVVLPFGMEVIAQCPMCRMAAESNLDAGGTEGRGLNTGILYLFSMPYLIAGILGFIWWKNRVKGADDIVDKSPSMN